MRTGSCKYRESYRFRQPDPTAAGGGDTTLPGRRISSARTINDTATPLRSIIYGPTSFMPNMNGYELQNHINEEFRLPVICEFLYPMNIYVHYITSVNLIDTTTIVH